MYARKLVVGLAALVLLLLAREASAGWVIDQVVRGGDEARHQVFLQSNRMKTLMHESDGKAAMAFIIDLNAETITTVDFRERSYMRATMREYVDAVPRMQQLARRQMPEMTKQMAAAMKDLPPEQRRMMEQMMRQQLGAQAGAAEQDCRDSEYELRATSQTATVAGFRATRHDLIADGTFDSQVWLARELTAWRELDLVKLQRFAAEMTTLAACAPGTGGAGAAAAWRAVREGYPVRVVDASGTTVEVVKAESRSIPAAEFEPPASFARKALGEMRGR